jgi:hypothetical protein
MFSGSLVVCVVGYGSCEGSHADERAVNEQQPFHPLSLSSRASLTSIAQDRLCVRSEAGGPGVHARASWCSPGEGSDPLKSSTREHPRQNLQAADVYGLKAYHERGQAGCKRKPNHTPTTYEPAFACIAKRRREHIPLGVASVFATLLVTGQAVSTSAELHTLRTRGRSTRQLQPCRWHVSSLSSSHLMVTEARYVDAGRVARVQHGGALGDLHGLAVHRHRDGLQRRPARAQRSRPLPSSASPRPTTPVVSSKGDAGGSVRPVCGGDGGYSRPRSHGGRPQGGG